MHFAAKWIVTLGLLLWSFGAQAVLTIEITRGVEIGTPIAIVPFGWEGQAPPAQNVSDVIEADLARSGRFAVLPRKDFISLPHEDKDVVYKDWRILKAEALVIGSVRFADGRWMHGARTIGRDPPSGAGTRPAGGTGADAASRRGAAAAPDAAEVRDSGVITLAHREASSPFSFIDQNKRPVGYALDLCLKVVEALRRELRMPGLRVEYLPVTAAQRIPSIVDGKADLECGNTTNTAARRKQVAFTMTHHFAGGRLLVRGDSKIQRLSDVGTRTVVAVRRQPGPVAPEVQPGHRLELQPLH